MIDAIHPRWLMVAAAAALVLGIVGLYSGWSAWAPMALLAGELLIILAAITFTTPSLPQSLAAQQAAAESRAVDDRATPADDDQGREHNHDIAE